MDENHNCLAESDIFNTWLGEPLAAHRTTPKPSQYRQKSASRWYFEPRVTANPAR